MKIPFRVATSVYFSYCNKIKIINFREKKFIWFMFSEVSVHDQVGPLLLILGKEAHHNGKGNVGANICISFHVKKNYKKKDKFHNSLQGHSLTGGDGV